MRDQYRISLDIIQPSDVGNVEVSVDRGHGHMKGTGSLGLLDRAAGPQRVAWHHRRESFSHGRQWQ